MTPHGGSFESERWLDPAVRIEGWRDWSEFVREPDELRFPPVAFSRHEISHRKGQRYLTVVVDHHIGRLVWAAAGRDRRTVLAFFDALGEERSTSGRCALVRIASLPVTPRR